MVQGKCVTSVCWLKFQHTLAACPEFWPNITMIGPNSWGSDSGEVCSGNCALHFASFYKDEVCMEWLDDMTLCDRWRLRPPLHGGCQPKPHMREDMEHLSAHCIEQAENEDILDMFIFIVALGLFAALCGPCSFYVSFHPVAERSPFCLTVARVLVLRQATSLLGRRASQKSWRWKISCWSKAKLTARTRMSRSRVNRGRTWSDACVHRVFVFE